MLIIAPILSTAAILFLVNAFPNLRKILPFTDYIKLPIPQKWLSYNKIHTLKPYFMGVMLGFMPCGLVLSALLITSTASTPYESALAMASFGIGTMPALILIAIGSKVVKQKYAHINYTFTRTLTVISSLWLCVTVGIILKGLQ
jgi:sulfite exporter TauE/SafE